ncbi:hypothetical protein H0A61_02881 [Koleobacter methoxysyntrophicus]|uniref:Uncharacterized protein n=1 Tax=Koleobacter methoxysyntrophicus TaxID=2751313 RepID=A0A8A0RQD7_9FIRM|nr:hypothetical protein [Koleobacter methoxysyntrophicus]QSQ10473.1 hypothetical protein H0A61_02881 [Koleobacter methoxysyntrophicus]
MDTKRAAIELLIKFPEMVCFILLAGYNTNNISKTRMQELYSALKKLEYAELEALNRNLSVFIAAIKKFFYPRCADMCDNLLEGRIDDPPDFISLAELLVFSDELARKLAAKPDEKQLKNFFKIIRTLPLELQVITVKRALEKGCAKDFWQHEEFNLWAIENAYLLIF